MPADRAASLHRLALGTCLSGLVACGVELPIGERVIDTRVLAVRNEVIAPIVPDDDPEAAPRCQALPFEGVRVTPWIVTPDGPLDLTGPDFDPVWVACNLGPGQGLFACLKAALPTTLADLPTCPVPSFTDLDPTSMSLPDSPSPCVLPADDSDDGAQDFVVPFASTLLLGGDLELTLVSRGPGSPSTEECAAPFFRNESDLPGGCIYVVQRVSVGPIERLLGLAAMFGVDLPPELGEPPDPEEIPDGDRNPRIVDFRVTRVAVDGGEEDLGALASGSVVQARPGDILKIVTNAAEADLQTYLVPINGGAGGTEERTESFDGSWFRTWGSLQANGSDDPMSRNEWTMERGAQDDSETPPGGRASLFYVLRDGRQGIDWWWISVELADE